MNDKAIIVVEIFLLCGFLFYLLIVAEDYRQKKLNSKTNRRKENGTGN